MPEPRTSSLRSKAKRDAATRQDPKRDSTDDSTDRGKKLGNLAVEAVWADITELTASNQVHAVGHYTGVLPLGAEFALDCKCSGCSLDHPQNLVITDWTRRGKLSGNLGSITTFSWFPDKIVVVAGMGRPGTFHLDQLRFLASNLARDVGLLHNRSTITTVLIGSGLGNLSVRDAVGGMIDGIVEARSESPGLKVDRLRIVERSLDRALEIEQELIRLRSEKPPGLTIRPHLDLRNRGGTILPGFGLSLMLAILAQQSQKRPGSMTDDARKDLLQRLETGDLNLDAQLLATRYRDYAETLKSSNPRNRGEAHKLLKLAMQLRLRDEDHPRAHDRETPTRLEFRTEAQEIYASAITDLVTVTERKNQYGIQLVAEAVDNLLESPEDKLQDPARSLRRFVVPRDFMETLRTPGPLIVAHDRSMARVPWEMLLLTGEHTEKPLGVARSLARQLQTQYSPRPDGSVPGRRLRALVIGGSGDWEHDSSLDQAQQEAKDVVEFIGKHGLKVDALIGSREKGTLGGRFPGIPPAAFDSVLAKLLSGEYDLVHYSGHADFDPAAPGQAGWQFVSGPTRRILTARMLENLEHPPRLIIANACLTSRFSEQKATLGAVAPGPAGDPEKDSRAVPILESNNAALVASLADEFFHQGVSFYIGTAWEVSSIPAKAFANRFYELLLPGELPIGEAVRRAREDLFKTFGSRDKSWAAYQLYGDPTQTWN